MEKQEVWIELPTLRVNGKPNLKIRIPQVIQEEDVEEYDSFSDDGSDGECSPMVNINNKFNGPYKQDVLNWLNSVDSEWTYKIIVTEVANPFCYQIKIHMPEPMFDKLYKDTEMFIKINKFVTNGDPCMALAITNKPPV